MEDILCDKLIMSGNNISTQIVEYKFKNTSKLIRRNKNSIAIINGEETDDEINNLEMIFLLTMAWVAGTFLNCM